MTTQIRKEYLDYGFSTDASTATPTPIGSNFNNDYFLTALATNATLAAPSGTPANGNRLIIRIKDNGTSRTLAYNSIYRAIGITLPTATTINKTIYLGMVYNGSDSRWDIVAYQLEA